MSDVNSQLKEKISAYKKQIKALQQKIDTANEDEKKDYDFELADLKAQLSLAESELKDTWGDISSENDTTGQESK